VDAAIVLAGDMSISPSLLLFLPILGAMLAHAPVLRFDLLPGLKRPLDGERTVRGRRIFGANKTWRGAMAMFLGVLFATLALAQLPAYWRRLPEGVAWHSPWLIGTLLGFGVVLGELPNSFIKRQIGIAEGTQRRSASCCRSSTRATSSLPSGSRCCRSTY
jgi:hypothetical protein